MIAVMSYETGIAPESLLDTAPEILAAMFEHRAALVKEAKKGQRRG